MEKGMRVVHNTAQKSESIYVYEIGNQICPCDKPLWSHIFEYATVHFVLSGKGNFNGQTLEAGQGFYVKEGQFVEYQQDSNDPWEYCWFDLSGETVNQVFAGVGFNKTMGVFDFTNISGIAKEFNNFFDEDFKLSDKNMLMTSYFYKVFSLLVIDYYNFMFTSNSISKAEHHFKNAIRFIANNYSHSITIEDIAAAENVERHYLNKLFRIYSDSSPQAHLIDYRIDKAKNLLRTTDYPVGTIANSVGYEDLLQFSRMFKKKVGRSPTEYRKFPDDSVDIK